MPFLRLARARSASSARGSDAHRRTNVLLVALLTSLLVLGGAPASVAHEELTGSAPEDGDVLTSAPQELRLTFSGDISPLGAQVQVTGPEDAVLDGDPRVAGAEVVHPLPADAPAGDYAVVWRVTSADGHPISGELSFTVETASTDGDTAAGTGTGGDTATVTDTAERSAATASGEDQDATTVRPEATARRDAPLAAGDVGGPADGGIPGWAWLAVGLAVLALGGIGVAALRGRA